MTVGSHSYIIGMTNHHKQSRVGLRSICLGVPAPRFSMIHEWRESNVNWHKPAREDLPRPTVQIEMCLMLMVAPIFPEGRRRFMFPSQNGSWGLRVPSSRYPLANRPTSYACKTKRDHARPDFEIFVRACSAGWLIQFSGVRDSKSDGHLKP